MEKLTPSQLRQIARDPTVAGMPHADGQVLGVAVNVLRVYLGQSWLENYFHPAPSKVEKAHRQGRAFMQNGANPEMQQARKHTRTHLLAEILFNLQEVGRINRVVESIRTGNLESGYAELLCGARLKRAGIKFGYLEEKTNGKRNPDIEIFWNGETVFCEVKSKCSGTIQGAGTFINSFKDARGQLPKGKRSIVFAVVPEEWITNKEWSDNFTTAVQDCFKNSNRIAAIVFQMERQIYPEKGEPWFMIEHRIFRNENPGVLTEDIQSLLNQINTVSSDCGWFDFRGLVDFDHQLHSIMT